MLSKGEAVALYDWAMREGLDRRSAILMVLRGLQGQMSEAKRKIEWWTKELEAIEAEIEAIEESAGIEVPLGEEPDKESGIMRFIDKKECPDAG